MVDNKKKTICCITNNRAEYSRIKSIFQEIENSSSLELKVVVSGQHLLSRHGNSINDIIEEIGAENITAKLTPKIKYPQLSLEAVVNEDPEAIVIPLSNNSEEWGEKIKEDWSKFSELSAVKSGKICLIDASTIVRPGMRLIDGMEELFLCLQGDPG